MESLPVILPPLSSGEVGDSPQVATLQQRLNEAEILLELTQTLTATTDRLQLLTSLTTAAQRLCNTDGFVLALFSPKGEALELLSQTDPSLHTQRFPLEDAAVREIFQIGRPIVIDDLSHPPLSARLLHILQGLGYTALVVVPLKIAHRITGIALASWRTSQASFPRAEELLQNLANQAAHHLIRIHAQEEQELYLRTSDALRRELDESRRRSTLFAGASHELRTPLNIILGYVDLLRDGHMGDISPEVANILDRVRQATLRLTTLVNDLLTLARLERAELLLSVTPVNIGALIEETYADWEQPIREKGLAFLRAGDFPLLKLATDKTRVRQILDNLLGNACKFTQRGHITIGTRVSDHTLQIWVEDTGIGIDEADQQRIFDEFQRARQKTTIQPGGVGLGLAVCKRLAYLLGGTIHVESTLNQGSTFTLVLPFHEYERPDGIRDENKSQNSTT